MIQSKIKPNNNIIQSGARGTTSRPFGGWPTPTSDLSEPRSDLSRLIARFLTSQSDQIPNRPNRLRRGQVTDPAMQVQPELPGQDVFRRPEPVAFTTLFLTVGRIANPSYDRLAPDKFLSASHLTLRPETFGPSPKQAGRQVISLVPQ